MNRVSWTVSEIIMNEIKVSIVTVCFNEIDDIEKTIKSVLSQNYCNIEYIVIDGGSDDGTLDIIKKYSDRIHLFVSEPDNGIYDAMNKGIEYSSGDLIGFMNAGDYYDEGAISAVVDMYKKSKSDVIYGNVTRLGGKNEQVIYDSIKLENYYLRNQIIHQAIFVKTSLMKKRGFNTIYGVLADYDFFLNLFYEGKEFTFLNYRICFYKGGGISETNEFQSITERKQIQMTLFEKDSALFEKYARGAQESYLYYMYETHKRCIPFYEDYALEVLRDYLMHFESIIVFGTGEISKKTISDLRITVKYYVDNDETKQGDEFYGRTIYPVESLKNETGGVLLILSLDHDKQMIDQIESLGVTKKIKVITYKQL